MNNNLENNMLSKENLENLSKYLGDKILLYAKFDEEYFSLSTELKNIDIDGIYTSDKLFIEFINEFGGIIDIISLNHDKLIYQNTNFTKNKVR